ncbi:MAG: hypothetical protein WB786_02740 [Thermoplasmata archaeon]
MASAVGDDLLLFVAGEPDSGANSIRLGGVGLLLRWTAMIVPGSGRLGPGGVPTPGSSFQQPPLTDARPWHLPSQQLICVNMVLEAAEHAGRAVTIVDVDRSGDQQDLVQRWFGPQDVIPLLVRPDGTRIMGVENFSPGKVRRFVDRR